VATLGAMYMLGSGRLPNSWAKIALGASADVCLLLQNSLASVTICIPATCCQDCSCGMRRQAVAGCYGGLA
jgi:hypothetical protein